MTTKEPWFRVKYRGGGWAQRPIALIRRGSSTDSPWADNGCAYMLTAEQAQQLHESLGEALQEALSKLQ